MPSAALNLIGNQQIAFFGLPDTNRRHRTGLTLTTESRYWGDQEVIYVRANGAIRQGGLCVITLTLTGGIWRWDASEVPNTANLGQSVYVAMTAMTDGQFGWVLNFGLAPINSTASIAANTAFGITAAGQVGAVSAGKQILNARVIAPATSTVAKTCTANSGSTQLFIPNADGWFSGIYLSGTGIAAGTTVTDIDPSQNIVTLSAATSAAVNGTVTGTYNNGTVFYNLAFVDHPFAQGQIT